jgi:hypothetical protein
MYRHITFEDGTEGYVQCEGFLNDVFAVAGIGVALIPLIISVFKCLKIKCDNVKANRVIQKINPGIISDIKSFMTDWKTDIDEFFTKYTEMTKRKFKEFHGGVNILFHNPNPTHPANLIQYMQKHEHANYMKPSDHESAMVDFVLIYTDQMMSVYGYEIADEEPYSKIQRFVETEISKSLKSGLKLKHSGITLKPIGDYDTTWYTTGVSFNYQVDIDPGIRWNKIYSKLKTEIESLEK